MALNNNFYIEIFENEKQWLDFLNLNLLNVYYLPQLRDFYLKKQNEILQEKNITNNEFLKNILNMINEMLDNINMIIESHKNGIDVDVKILSNCFLINQMNNNVKSDNEVTIVQLNDDIPIEDDYLCDEFDEEVKPLKR